MREFRTVTEQCYSTCAQVCVRLKRNNKLQSYQALFILLPWAMGVFRSMLAAEIPPKSHLHLEDYCASTICLGDI